MLACRTGGVDHALSSQALTDLIEIVLQNRAHAFVARRVNGQCFGAGGFETFVAVFLGQSYQAQTGTKALLGMRATAQDLFDQSGGGRPGPSGPLRQSLWRPFQIGLMRLGHMLGAGNVALQSVAGAISWCRLHCNADDWPRADL